MDLLTNTFVRLDSDVTFGDGNVAYLRPIVTECIPGYFSCLEEARIHLGALNSTIYDIFHDLDSMGEQVVASRRDISVLSEEELFCLASVTSRLLPPDSHPKLLQRMQTAKEDLRCWSSAFTLLPHEVDDSSGRLMVQIEYLELWLATCRWKDEREDMIDRFEDYFGHLLHMAERYVDLHVENHTARHAFPLGTNLVPCLAGIAWKCRVPVPRRWCIALLRRIDLRGISDSEYLAAVSEKVVDLEESRAREILHLSPHDTLTAADIPEEARILELEMCRYDDTEDFWKLDTGRFVYVTTGAGTADDLELHDAIFGISRTTQADPGDV